MQKIVDFIQDTFKTKEFIPLHEPRFIGNEKKYLNDCIDSTFVSSVGKYVDTFEAEFAKKVGAKYAVATVNGTAALHVSLILADVKRDDEVITLTLIITIYGAGYIISDTFKTRVQSGISDIQKIQNHNYDTSWGIRIVYWMITYDILKENPFFGVGVGDYEQALKKKLELNNYPISESTQDFMLKYHAHNQYLMVIIQIGLLGLLLLFNIVYQLYRMKIEDDEIKKLSLLFLTIYFISSMAEPLWIKQFTLALFILFVGIFIVASQKKTL